MLCINHRVAMNFLSMQQLHLHNGSLNKLYKIKISIAKFSVEKDNLIQLTTAYLGKQNSIDENAMDENFIRR